MSDRLDRFRNVERYESTDSGCSKSPIHGDWIELADFTALLAVAEEQQLYTANVDEIPDITTQNHEICDEVSAATVAAMWLKLKQRCMVAEAKLSTLREENIRLKAIILDIKRKIGGII